MSIRVITVMVVLLALSSGLVGQEKKQEPAKSTQTFKIDAGNAVIIRELGAVITEENERVAVKFIPPKDRRPKEIAGEDIEVGDEVGMANGKRVTRISELRKLYEETPVGSEFKLGVKRNGQPRIVTFAKKDPKEAMQGGMMIVGGDGKPGGARFFPALGMGLDQREKKVIIGKALPNLIAGLKEGDQIETLNEKRVSNVDDFAKELDATKVGAELKFGLVREGKKISVSAPRPEPRGQMMIKTN